MTAQHCGTEVITVTLATSLYKMVFILPIQSGFGGGGCGGGGGRRVRYRTPRKVKKQLKTLRRKVRATGKLRRAMGVIEPRGGPASINRYGATWKDANVEQRIYRSGLNYRGHGDYASDIQAWGKKYIPTGTFTRLGDMAGSALGGMYGGPLGTLAGGAVGAGLGNRVAQWAGFGDYGQRSVNQIMGGHGEGPLSVNSGHDMSGDVYINHREFIGNIQAQGAASGVSAFNNVSYPINAAMFQTFPWLSQIAQNFTLYDFKGLIFQYKPTSGESASTSSAALGKVVLATQYDPAAEKFANSVSMENYDYANAGKPSVEILHGVETAEGRGAVNMLYTRVGATTRDKIFTDIGTLQVATEGLPVGTSTSTYYTVGELWVAYSVKLSRANLFGSLQGGNIQQDNFISATSGATNLAALQTYFSSAILAKYNATPASGTMYVRSSNTIGGAATSSDTATILYTFPANISAGAYRITLYAFQTGTQQTVSNNGLSLTNCVIQGPYGIIDASSVATYGPYANVTQSTIAGGVAHSTDAYIQVTAPGNLQATVSINLTGTNTMAAHYSLTVIQVPVKMCL